ncbi:MAG: alpha-L-rhamnosidase N-terminal domain-containing protein, partial [Kiritimatiellae bacterium]|nr:alpha-L-rhamnosidase N-terminal domain-containing protein [Kiritimatiellia bacterium]
MNMRIASLLAACAAVMCAWGAESVGIVGLQVNHLAEPRHVGAQPSFGWRMETARAGARQVAYRVKVARTARNASQETVWDSGEVADGRSVGIAYAGNPLKSACRYAWTVAVKDEQGRWTESAPARFSTGLLVENDWKGADWIAPSADGGGTPSLPVSYGLRTGCFRRAFANPKRVVEAWWCVTAAGVFDIYANGRTVTDEFLKPGYTHPLKVRQACTYDMTAWIDCRAGATNVFGAVVSASWSRDKISCRNRPGRRYDPALAPTLRAVLILRHADGTETRVATDRDWRAAMDRHPVRAAGIYEGEAVDARTNLTWLSGPEPNWPRALTGNTDFPGTVRNFRGPPVTLRDDLAMRP